MHKIALIIQREFLTRVRKRTFIISTILFPLLYLGLIFGTSYIAEKTKDNLKIGIIDSSGLFREDLVKIANGIDTVNSLHLVTTDKAAFMARFDSMGYDGYVVVPEKFSWKKGVDSANVIRLNTRRTFGLGATEPAEKKLNKIWELVKKDSLGIDTVKQSIINRTMSLKMNNEKNRNSDAGPASVIGYVSGFLMYLILLLYGSQVMMGVTEEKTNRIAEVVVSSVKPFQLMIGKIIGIGFVALTQFLIWISCIFIIYNISKANGGSADSTSSMVGSVQNVFTSVNMLLVVSCFVFYLLAGFFFYSSLYAAIGSAINEDMREAQSLSFPITMLVMFSIFIMGAVIKDPNSPLAVWASIIPFSSPIIMMVRIPFGVPYTVPYWQLGLSMLLLVGGFIFTTWFAGRIYRTGILMYGKKPSWKEMIRWALSK